MWVFLLGAYQYSMAESAKLNLLKNIDVVTSVDKTKIELRFNGTPNEKGISYHEDFMQMEFPDTYVEPAKQWINVEDETVKNIFLYQLDETTVRARFFTLGKAGRLKDKINLLREENKIIITYNVAPEADRSTAAPAEKTAVAAEKGADSKAGPKGRLRAGDKPRRHKSVEGESIQKPGAAQKGLGVGAEDPLIVRGDLLQKSGAAASIIVRPETGGTSQIPGPIAPPSAEPAPAVSGISASVEETPKTSIPPSKTISKNTLGDKPLIADGTGSPDLYASLLKMILALGILLALLFAGLFVFKRFMGKKIGIAGQNPGIKIITSAYIGPKKSIALVDISGERIVVGITPDHISMLARLGKEGEFGNILEEQMSSNDKVELHDDLWEKV